MPYNVQLGSILACPRPQSSSDGCGVIDSCSSHSLPRILRYFQCFAVKPTVCGRMQRELDDMVRIKKIVQGPLHTPLDPCNSHRVRWFSRTCPLGVQARGQGMAEMKVRYAPRMLQPWLENANLRFATAVSLLLSILCRGPAVFGMSELVEVGC